MAGAMAVVTASVISSCTAKDFGEVAIVALGPDVVAGPDLDQLRAHADTIAGFAQAAFQDITHAQIAPDLLHVYRAALIGEGRIAGDHEQ